MHLYFRYVGTSASMDWYWKKKKIRTVINVSKLGIWFKRTQIHNTIYYYYWNCGYYFLQPQLIISLISACLICCVAFEKRDDVIFDAELSFDTQATKMVQSCIAQLKLLSIIGSFLPFADFQKKSSMLLSLQDSTTVMHFALELASVTSMDYIRYKMLLPDYKHIQVKR